MAFYQAHILPPRLRPPERRDHRAAAPAWCRQPCRAQGFMPGRLRQGSEFSVGRLRGGMIG